MLWVKGLDREGQAGMAGGGEQPTEEEKAVIKQIILSGHLNIAQAQLKVSCGNGTAHCAGEEQSAPGSGLGKRACACVHTRVWLLRASEGAGGAVGER